MSADQRPRDLAQELIDAALRILSEEGLENLTLRRVAASVGVSHAAPAYHFRGLPHLLGCLVGVGFESLSQAIETQMHSAEKQPVDQLVAACEGYVMFAVENPGLIQLMFSTDKSRVEKVAFGDSGQKAYRLLSQVCAPFEPISSAEDSLETMIWSIIHGFALLTIGGRFDNPGRRTLFPKVSDVLPRLQLRKS